MSLPAHTRRKAASRAKKEGSNDADGPRPYRSHLQPACEQCRRKRSRCTVDLPDQACLLCRLNRLPCNFPRSRKQHDGDQSQKKGSKPAAQIRGQVKGQGESADVEAELPYKIATLEGNVQESSHIVGPAQASDAEAVQKYLEGIEGTSSSRSRPYLIQSRGAKQSIPFMPVKRPHGGVKFHTAPGTVQYEIASKLLEPYADELMRVFFQKVHPCFPVLHQSSVETLHRDDRDMFPPALLCDIYATALKFWVTSPTLKIYPRPDITYVWSLAIHALMDDFLSPGISTVSSAVYMLGGRPTTTMTGNAINLGRTVALAYSLGLNRDPRQWNLGQEEKRLRIRAWWAILIHDRWLSLAHGTPPLIQRQHCDVSMPEPQDLLSDSSDDAAIASAEVYLALCRLTESLGDILDHVYNITSRDQEALQQMQSWNPPDNWRKHVNPTANGVSNLNLAYLAVRMLVSRISLNNSKPHSLDHIVRCQSAAQAVVDFTTTLSTPSLYDFWLPYAAYHFTSACTLLLRCTLEFSSKSPAQARACFASAQTLLDTLRTFKEEHDWDLADICLAQCGPIVERMAEAFAGAPSTMGQDVEESMTALLDDFGPWSAGGGGGEGGWLLPDIWDMLQFDGGVVGS